LQCVAVRCSVLQYVVVSGTHTLTFEPLHRQTTVVRAIWWGNSSRHTTHTHTHTHTDRHTCKYTTHTHTHTHTQTYIHTITHTHTRSLSHTHSPVSRCIAGQQGFVRFDWVIPCVCKTKKMCDMTHKNLQRDWFISVTWLIRMQFVAVSPRVSKTKKNVRHDAYMCATWLI